jgi:hypothetical protein
MEAPMKPIRTTRLTVLALVALGVAFNLSAPDAFAKLTGTGGTQKITVNGGTAECGEASVSGTGTLTKFTTLILAFKYTKCTFGEEPATVSVGEYEFDANGSLAVLYTVTITSAFEGCTIKIAPTGNKDLEAVRYETRGAKLVEAATLKGITYTSSGGVCGTSGKNGTYSGTAEIEE